ncbi:MFS transporter [Martelella mangrovi]|uniref:DHA2 family multidrug resistance protein n=1 Tax=Martelella mangrovi TaxID=1397477 RepID=A0ABV2IBV9_9HYPH
MTAVTASAASSTDTPPQQPAAPRPAAPPVLDARIVATLTGVLISAMMSGLNSRAGGLALSDIRGAMGQGIDGGSWITSFYSAGELLVMPFATWFAITLTVRRFYMIVLGTTALVALVQPFIVDLHLLLALRLVQGISGGALIPILMMMALRFLPPAIRLHGLALYALTATFTPNVAIWVVGHWTDTAADLRWVSWQFLPAAALCALLVGWGLPKEPVIWPRFKGFNLAGFLTGIPALFLLAIAFSQGNRLDWFNSPLICFCLIGSAICLAAYIASELAHPSPFIRFELLGRRNLQVGFTIFFILLGVLYSGAGLPATFLGALQNYRALQVAPIGLIIGLPQIVLGSVVAALLYQKWVDARYVLAGGLVLIGLACFWGAQIDPSWTWRQFVPAQILQAIGQPMAVVSMLFLATSVVQQMEGPYIAGLVNTLRAAGTVVGVAAVGRLELIREHFHSSVLVGHAAAVSGHLPAAASPDALDGMIAAQVMTLTIADCYRVLGVIALLLAPLALLSHYIPAPMTRPAPSEK